MKKIAYIFIIFLALFHNIEIVAHGFAAHTLVNLESSASFLPIQEISSGFFRGQRTKVVTYKEKSRSWKTQSVQAVAFCQATISIDLCFGPSDQKTTENIVCSPLQLFYRASDRSWVSAYDLCIGDIVLCENNRATQLLSKQERHPEIKFYILQIKKHHTFVVGRQKILTHNVFIPIVATMGMAIPFDIVFQAGAWGCIFGPVTFCCSVAVAGVVAGIVHQCSKKRGIDFILGYDGKNYAVRTIGDSSGENFECSRYPVFDPCNSYQNNNSLSDIGLAIHSQPLIVGCGSPVVASLSPTGFGIPAVASDITDTILPGNLDGSAVDIVTGCGYPARFKNILYDQGTSDGTSIWLSGDLLCYKKTVDDILAETVPGKKTRGKSIQFVKPGFYEDTLKDFESLQPSFVRNLPENIGLHGVLDDGRDVIARKQSKGDLPTLEIQPLASNAGKYIKIRYDSSDNSKE